MIFAKRQIHEVPAYDPAPALAERKRLYQGFVARIGRGEVGELQPDEGESLRQIKVRLRRAATRLDREIEIWDGSGRVYFQPLPVQSNPHRRRAS